MPDSFRPRLSPDSPASKDKFKAHSAIARAIRLLIETSDQGYGVALIGERGSGKSTVLVLLQAMCAEAGQGCRISVFRFHAWAHEGDNLRRAFLEQLALFLRTERLLSRWWGPGKIKRFRAKLRGGAERTREGLTLGGISAAAFAIMAFAIAGAAVDKYGWNATPVWECAVALLLLAAILGLVDFLCAPFSFPLFSRSASHVVREPAPSSVEFADRLRELLGGSKLEPKKTALVIALEDLDRLPKREREQAYSVMRTYTDALASPGDEPWRKALWTVVPVEGRGGTSEKGAMRSDLAAAAAKICQIRFFVPPPIVSDWREFLAAQLKEQVGWEDEDVEAAVATYSSRVNDVPGGRSPRMLKAFVNQVVALAALNAKLDPAAGHAPPFAVARLAVNEIALGRSVDPAELLAEGGSDAASAMAALLLNRAEEDALQAFFEPQVAPALERGDQEKLGHIIERCPRAIDVALHVVEREGLGWATDNPRKIGLAALALGKHLSGAVAVELAKRGAGAKAWRELDERSGEGLGLLSAAVPSFAAEIFRGASGVMDAVVGSPQADNCSLAILALADAAGNALAPAGAKLEVGATPRGFLLFIAKLREKAFHARVDRFAPGCGPAEVVRFLKAAQRDDEWVRSISAAAVCGLDVSWVGEVAISEAHNAQGPWGRPSAALAAAVMVVGHSNDVAILGVNVARNDGLLFELIESDPGPATRNALLLGALITGGSGTRSGNESGGEKLYTQAVGAKGRVWEDIAKCALDARADRFVKDRVRLLQRVGGPEPEFAFYVETKLKEWRRPAAAGASP